MVRLLICYWEDPIFTPKKIMTNIVCVEKAFIGGKVELSWQRLPCAEELAIYGLEIHRTVSFVGKQEQGKCMSV